MALFDKVYVIDYRDKPFGAVFALDVQNRILCMSWYADHRDRYAAVLAELRSIPKCHLTDWCCHSTRLLRDTIFDLAVNKIVRLKKPHCAWCVIYWFDNESISLRTLDLTLERRRQDLLPTSSSYPAFVQEYAQRYADEQLFTLTHVLVPMLKWKPPHLVAFDHQLAPTGLSFDDIQHAHNLLWSSFKLSLGGNVLRNTRVLFEEDLNELRTNVDRFLNQDEEASPDA